MDQHRSNGMETVLC